MKVLMISAEVAPFAKVGGLADVAGSLPKALAARGVDIRVIMPKYRTVGLAGQPLQRALETVYVPMTTHMTGCALDVASLPGTDIPCYFVEHNHYFDRDSVYGTGGGFPDNFERLAFFCRAALASLEGLQWQPDVLHLNDYHTALAAAYTKSWDLPFGTLFTAHNLGLGYQGTYPWEQIGLAGLDMGDRRIRDAGYDGQISLARLGFIFADLINTVSKSYAKEICSPEVGQGISDLAVARGEDVKGIVNGIDYEVWNPGDAALPAPFSPDDLAGKAACKAAAQREFGLPPKPDVPLLALITRLDAQKGLDLLAEVVTEFGDVQVAILGTGDPSYERLFADLAKGSTNLGLKLMFSASLARLLYAGCDMFLMPSRYEPCGLGQMIALAYGSIPVVRATGGLADTIKEKTKTPNGFRFADYDAQQLLEAVGRAVEAYHDKPRWSELVANAFASDFSWEASAKQYLSLYRAAAARAGG